MNQSSQSGEKLCCVCRISKPTTEFHLNRTRKGGLQATCKPCQSQYSCRNWRRWKESRRRYARSWKGRNIVKKCKITKEEFNAKLAEQKNCCGVCGNPFEFVGEPLPSHYVYIDHNHTTMEFRGVLCPGCNSAIAYLEIPGWLEKALRYVEKAGGGQK